MKPPVKTFRSDGGGEFNSGELRQILAEKGIAPTLRVPYSPERNGAAAREKGTTVEMARSILSTSAFPRSFGHGLNTLMSFVILCKSNSMMVNYSSNMFLERCS